MLMIELEYAGEELVGCSAFRESDGYTLAWCRNPSSEDTGKITLSTGLVESGMPEGKLENDDLVKQLVNTISSTFNIGYSGI